MIRLQVKTLDKRIDDTLKLKLDEILCELPSLEEKLNEIRDLQKLWK